MDTGTQFRPDPARKLSAKHVWHIPLLCVQWKTPDDGQRNCPKHVEFCSKNKFQKSVRLVGFIIKIYHDARSSERQMCNIRQLCVGRYPNPALLYSTQWEDKHTIAKPLNKRHACGTGETRRALLTSELRLSERSVILRSSRQASHRSMELLRLSRLSGLWRHNICLKRRNSSTTLHGVTSQTKQSFIYYTLELFRDSNGWGGYLGLRWPR